MKSTRILPLMTLIVFAILAVGLIVETKSTGSHTTIPILPANNSWVNGTNDTIVFTFNRTDTLGANGTEVSCSLRFSSNASCGLVVGVVNHTWYNVSCANSIAEGTHTWTVQCQNSTGSIETSGVMNLNVDRTKPTVTLILPANDTGTTNGTINFIFKYTDNINTSSVCELVINNAVNSSVGCSNNTEANISVSGFNDTYIKQNRFNWTIRVNDTVPNNGSATRVIHVDNLTPSAIALIGPNSSANVTSPVSLLFNVSDNVDLVLSCKIFINGALNNTVNANNASITTVATPFLDGHYNWSVECQDNAGNKNSTANNTMVIVDSSRPTIINPQPPTPDNNSVQTSNSIQFNYTFTDANPVACVLENQTLNNFTMTLNGNSSAGWYCNITLSVGPDGVKNFTVWVNDSAGNTNNSKRLTITVDTTAPTSSGRVITNITRGFDFIATVNHTITDVNSNISGCFVRVYDARKNRLPTNITGTINETGKNVACYTEINASHVVDGALYLEQWGNDTLGTNLAVANITNYTATTLYSGWNAITANRNMTLADVANMSSNITRVSWFNISSQSYVTYVVGLSANNLTNATVGDGLQVQVGGTVTLIRLWYNNSGYRNLSLNAGWSLMFAFNFTGISLKEVCTDTNGTYSNTSVRYVSWYNASNTQYITHRCGFRTNNATIVPRGHAFWANFDNATTLIRQGFDAG